MSILMKLESTDMYYCSAVMLIDLDIMRNRQKIQKLRFYYSKLHTKHNQIELMPVIDQGLMNYANREMLIIESLP